MNSVIGIDPGLDGAVAWRSGVDNTVTVADTPTLTVQGASGKRREYNLVVMRGLLKGMTFDGTKAYIELVHAMPGQGVRSMFTMGYGSGAWEGLLAGLGIPYERVTPQRWKKLMLADQGKDKDAARFKAIQLFPDHAHLFARNKDDGRADATLIAEYGRRQQG